MVTVTADCRRVDGRTLVECRLTNDRDAPVRVRLESRLDGPTWPPRDDDGHPSREWRDGVWTGVLAPGETAGVGFATPAHPAESPVSVEARETDTASTPDARFGRDPTPEDVTRELTDPRPPRAGLLEDKRERDVSEAASKAEPAVEPTDAWFDDVADRVERLEALDAARTLPEATVAVADADGLAGVRWLRETTERDREQLLELAGRAERLAGRIEAADVPVETLERLS